MAQLGADVASRVDNAVDPTGLIDEGIYLATLSGKVKVWDGTTLSWSWPFTIDATDAEGNPQPFAGRKIDHKTWLSEAADYRLRKTFEAFGVPASTDTDELEGQKVRIRIIVKDKWGGELDDDGLPKLVNDVRDVLTATGNVGIDEAAKTRRVKAREAAKAELEANPIEGGSTDEPLF